MTLESNPVFLLRPPWSETAFSELSLSSCQTSSEMSRDPILGISSCLELLVSGGALHWADGVCGSMGMDGVAVTAAACKLVGV